MTDPTRDSNTVARCELRDPRCRSCILGLMSYRKLRIWQMARELTADIHNMTLTALPKHELYEEGSQIRRAIKSVRSNIVEGYGRRDYRRDFIRFLVIAHASCDETLDHLEMLYETGSLADESLYTDLHSRVDELGRALGGFIRSVESKHRSVREELTDYNTAHRELSPRFTLPRSRTSHLASSWTDRRISQPAV